MRLPASLYTATQEAVSLGLASSQNAFQPKATFIREVRRDHSTFEWKDKYYASAEIKSFEVAGPGDFTQKIQFIAPDDGNKDDKTVIDLPLRKAIAPGEFVQIKIAFQTKFPETQARSGWKS